MVVNSNGQLTSYCLHMPGAEWHRSLKCHRGLAPSKSHRQCTNPEAREPRLCLPSILRPVLSVGSGICTKKLKLTDVPDILPVPSTISPANVCAAPEANASHCDLLRLAVDVYTDDSEVHAFSKTVVSPLTCQFDGTVKDCASRPSQRKQKHVNRIKTERKQESMTCTSRLGGKEEDSLKQALW